MAIPWGAMANRDPEKAKEKEERHEEFVCIVLDREIIHNATYILKIPYYVERQFYGAPWPRETLKKPKKQEERVEEFVSIFLDR
jgi:hypothetical protein